MIPLLLAVAALQDAGPLIERLEDARPDVREEAERALIGIGEPAIPALERVVNSGDARGELRMRATRALREIRDRAEVRLRCPDARRITLRAKERPLGGVLDEIARLANVKIDRSRIDADAPVTLDFEDGPLLRALDVVCRKAGNVTYRVGKDGILRFERGTHPAWPTAYAGPFRIRMTSLSVTRQADFKTTSATAEFGLEMDGEPGSIARHELTITEATDDTGKKLTTGGTAGPLPVLAGRGGVFVVQAGGSDEPSNAPWHVTGLDPAAKRISLRGEAHLFIPLAPRPVRFENGPQAGRKVTLGAFEVELERTGPDCRFKVTRTSEQDPAAGEPDLKSRIDPASVVAVDGNGKEHRPAAFGPTNEIESVIDLNVLVVGGPNGRVVRKRRGHASRSFSARFTSLPGGLKELRFTLADRVYEKVVPFGIGDIDLP